MCNCLPPLTPKLPADFQKTSGQCQSPICRFVNKTTPVACYFGHFPYVSHVASNLSGRCVSFPRCTASSTTFHHPHSHSRIFHTQDRCARVRSVTTFQMKPVFFWSVVFFVFCCFCCFSSIVVLCLLYFLSLFYLFFVNLSLLPYPTRK